MSKLYFIDTNGGYLTVATNEDGRACYMWQDGKEENYPSNDLRWDEADAQEREEIVKNYLRSIADANDFDSLYTNCDSTGGFVGVYTVADFEHDLCDFRPVVASVSF